MRTEQLTHTNDDVARVADGYAFTWKRRVTLPFIILPALTISSIALSLDTKAALASDGNDATHTGDWQEGISGPDCRGTLDWQEGGILKCTDPDHQAEMAEKLLATPTPKQWTDLPGNTGIQVTEDVAQGGAVVCVGSALLGLVGVSLLIHKAVRG